MDDDESEEENLVNRDTLFFEWKPDVEGEDIDLEMLEIEEEAVLPSDQLQENASVELLR